MTTLRLPESVDVLVMHAGGERIEHEARTIGKKVLSLKVESSEETVVFAPAMSLAVPLGSKNALLHL